MSSLEPPAEAAFQEPFMQDIIPKPPPQAPWLADCDAFKNPPPSYRKIHNNRITPMYLLAWTCSREEYYANVSDDRWQANSALEQSIVWDRLFAACGDTRDDLIFPFQIEVMYGHDGEVYLGVISNFQLEKRLDKIKALWKDESFLYIRDAFGITKNEALDKTLAWYQYPARMDKNRKALRWQAT